MAAPGTAAATEIAPVGLGAAAGMPPLEAQVPTQMVAMALPTTCFTEARALSPPTVQ